MFFQVPLLSEPEKLSEAETPREAAKPKKKLKRASFVVSTELENEQKAKKVKGKTPLKISPEVKVKKYKIEDAKKLKTLSSKKKLSEAETPREAAKPKKKLKRASFVVSTELENEQKAKKVKGKTPLKISPEVKVKKYKILKF